MKQFNKSNTYFVDLPLFKELGLAPFNINTHEKKCIGEYKLPNYDKAKVKISVTCTPAQFWEFEVETDENYKFIISTGSGALSDYWTSVLKVAEGCFVVKEIK